MTALGTTLGPGSVLGERFVLSERLGTGATARVFLATDLRRQCPVAVKVLHESLAADPRFVRLFDRESRLVASLAHDHIVTVIDAGSADTGDLEVPYIVTEYMAGGSLASMLDAGERLDVAQVASVGAQAADALAYAHRRGMVHRDVKPSNLLFDAGGRLALADFGIARAVASASSTEPVDSGQGATRYASPEQVIGHNTDPKSDVYSLALVLIEAATGSVPLLGDSQIATMGRRAREKVQVPVQLTALAPALEAATDLDADQRCDAEELGSELARFGGQEQTPVLLPLIPTLVPDENTEELVVQRSGGSVRIIGPVPSGSGNSRAIPTAPPAVPVGDTTLDLRSVEPPPDTGEFGRDAIAVAEEYRALGSSRPESLGVVEPMEQPQVGEVDVARPRRGRLVAAILVLAALAGGAAWWFLIRVPTHSVPDWVGVQFADATAAAESNGWVVADPELVRRDGTTAGAVLEQAPVVGTDLAEGERISFVVSEGPTLTDVPPLEGLGESEAVAAIESAGLVPGTRTTGFDEEVPAGAVISAAPAPGTQVPEGDARVPKQSAIDYVVSDGPAPRAVPGGLVGATFADAQTAIEAVQLVAAPSEEYSSTVPEGVVVSVGAEPGTELPRGAPVDLVVSAGPEPIRVPDVTGSTGTAAAARLEGAGFSVSGIEGSPSGSVLATDPPAGEMRQRGASVRIFTRSG